MIQGSVNQLLGVVGAFNAIGDSLKKEPTAPAPQATQETKVAQQPVQPVQQQPVQINNSVAQGEKAREITKNEIQGATNQVEQFEQFKSKLQALAQPSRLANNSTQRALTKLLDDMEDKK